MTNNNYLKKTQRSLIYFPQTGNDQTRELQFKQNQAIVTKLYGHRPGSENVSQISIP
ncbi:MAG: hypothetical protein QNJ68_03080 [Microcoleaceae cyanobacterium MO_207.B10]|nr:hypothetical protein [Microcoleaceae cyanobacterium MO_207.B10]